MLKYVILASSWLSTRGWFRHCIWFFYIMKVYTIFLTIVGFTVKSCFNKQFFPGLFPFSCCIIFPKRWIFRSPWETSGIYLNGWKYLSMFVQEFYWDTQHIFWGICNSKMDLAMSVPFSVIWLLTVFHISCCYDQILNW